MHQLLSWPLLQHFLELLLLELRVQLQLPPLQVLRLQPRLQLEQVQFQRLLVLQLDPLKLQGG